MIGWISQIRCYDITFLTRLSHQEQYGWLVDKMGLEPIQNKYQIAKKTVLNILHLWDSGLCWATLCVFSVQQDWFWDSNYCGFNRITRDKMC